MARKYCTAEAGLVHTYRRYSSLAVVLKQCLRIVGDVSVCENIAAEWIVVVGASPKAGGP